MRGHSAKISRPTIGLLALMLNACEQQHDDLTQYINAIHQRPSEAIEALPEFSIYQAAAYNGNLVRDPFAPAMKPDERGQRRSNQDGPKPDIERPKEHLENFPLDGIRIVGMMGFDGTRYALLRTNEPTLYRTTVGNYIGQNHGKVVAINNNGLTIRELIPNGNGGWRERTQELTVENAN